MVQTKRVGRFPRLIEILRLNSLHVRLAILTGMVLVSSILFNSLYVANDQSAFVAKVTEQQAVALAINIGSAATESLILEDLSALEQLLLGAARFPGVQAIQMLDEKGQLLSSVIRNNSDEPVIDFASKVLTPPRDVVTHTAFGSDDMEVWYPVVSKTLIGWVHIQSGLESVGQVQSHIWRLSILAAAIAVFVAVTALWLFMRKPMHALRMATGFAEQLNKIRGSQLDTGSRITEIARLEHALNRTSSRLYGQEDALKESSERLASVLNHAIEAIITIDAHGIIESFNPAAEKIFGYQQSEVVGTNISRLMPEPYCSKHDQFIHRYLTTGERRIVGLRREVVGLRKEGQQFPMELGVSEIHRDGEVWFTGVVRDLTEVKQIEGMKSEFISTVSHELRTPLTSIRGALLLMAGGVAGQLPDKARELIDIGVSNCERLMHIINDILDIGKIESGKLVFQLEPLSIVSLLRKAIEDNRIYADQYGVQFILNSAVPDDALVYADAQRLSQVVANLVSNAAKFSKSGGCVTLSVHETDAVIRVTVADQGVGIPEAFRDRIFQKFAQADASDARQKGGTGLGLHISKLIIEKHAGRIGFESEEGKGSTFYFELHRWTGNSA